jgi:flagellar biogenesis protein FliO
VGRVRAESEECPIRSVVTMIAISALISILTFVAAAAFWVDRAVLREAAFLESATEVLEMDSSHQALAERLMDEAVDAVPLLAFVRGAGERATVALLDNGAFDETIKSLVVAGHRHVMAQEEGPFTADLTEVRAVIVEPIAQIAPDLAERIPVDAFRAVVIADSEAVPAVGRAASWVPVVSVFSAAGAVFLAIALVMLADRRSIALVLVGAAVLIAGLGVVVWSAWAGPLAASGVDDPISRVLVENGYAVFSRSLRIEGLWLALGGTAVAAAGLVGFLVGQTRERQET